MSDLVGEQFGNYRLIAPLGRGGFAEVYRAQHVRLNTYAAIKLLHAHLAEDDADNFLREARIIAELNHPNIVRVFDFDIRQGRPFLVMDYYPNGTLRGRHGKGTRLPLSVIVPYVRQIAEALQYAHDRKLIHRDVKPENMLVGQRGEILLGDFGIAAIAHNTSSMSSQAPLGTIPYMAPEQIQAYARPASDQYALAVVVYEWLCGKPPFNGSSTEILSKHLVAPPPSLRAKLPSLVPAVEQVILKALAKEPRQRFASVRDFAKALETASQGQLATILPSSNAGPLASERTFYPPHGPLPLTVEVPPRIYTQTAKAPETTSAPSDKPFKNLFNAIVSHRPFQKKPEDDLDWLSLDESEHRPRLSRGRRKLLIGLATAGVVAVGGSMLWHTLVPYSSTPFPSNPGIVYVYHGHSGAISTLAWSPDDRYIASGTEGPDSTVQVWEATTGKHVYTFEGHVVKGFIGTLYTVESVAWSPDGKRIVSTSPDGLYFVWDAANGGNEVQLNAPGLDWNTAAWSPNGKYIAWTVEFDQVQIGETGNLNDSNYYTVGNSNDTGAEVKALAWSPDSRYIAFACLDNTVQVWDTLSRQGSIYHGHTDVVNTVAWSPDGRYIASGSKDKTVRVWEAVNRASIFVYKNHSDEVRSVTWSPDSKRIASASIDGTAQVWEALNGKNVYIYLGHSSPLFKGATAIAWSHNGQYIASGGEDHTVQVWKPL